MIPFFCEAITVPTDNAVRLIMMWKYTVYFNIHETATSELSGGHLSDFHHAISKTEYLGS